MCGFAGYYNLDQSAPANLEIAEKMSRTLVHRGPDAEGHYLDGNVALGHRRLSIIDTSLSARQPLQNEDGTVTVAVNGEIYNYKELKATFEQGHRFKSSSDSEVLVHAYEEWGINFIKRLDGMFSFALYDKRIGKMLLATDPFGKKPLYYSQQGGVFLFASELKALAQHPQFVKELNHLSVAKYLAHDFIPHPNTIFQNVFKLSRASFLMLNTKDAQHSLPEPKLYWDLKFEPKLRLTEHEAIIEFRNLMNAAVKKRLMSDVPLGVFLSGGIDSSIILAEMANIIEPSQIKTYNIGFREKSFDESSYSRLVAEHIGTDHHEKIFDSGKLLEVLPTVIEKMDEPFGDPSILPTYLLCNFTRRDITVALGGDGSDELFAGYDPFLAHRLSSLYGFIPSPVFRMLKKMLPLIQVSDTNLSLDFKIKHFLKGLESGGIRFPELRNVMWMGSFSRNNTIAALSQDTLGNISTEDIYSETINRAAVSPAVNLIDRVTDNYINLYLQGDILVKVDRASMMNSLEVRSPFLDKDLAEFAGAIRPSLKIYWLRRKYLLKKSYKGVLLDEILYRKKKGFGIPVASWLRGPLKEIMDQNLGRKQIAEDGFFNPSFIENMRSRHLSRQSDYRKELWNLLIFQLWWKNIGGKL